MMVGFRPCVFLGTGELAGAKPVSCWRDFATLDEARRAALHMQKVAQLFPPMYSGWVLGDVRERVW